MEQISKNNNFFHILHRKEFSKYIGNLKDQRKNTTRNIKRIAGNFFFPLKPSVLKVLQVTYSIFAMGRKK